MPHPNPHSLLWVRHPVVCDGAFDIPKRTVVMTTTIHQGRVFLWQKLDQLNKCIDEIIRDWTVTSKNF